MMGWNTIVTRPPSSSSRSSRVPSAKRWGRSRRLGTTVVGPSTVTRGAVSPSLTRPTRNSKSAKWRMSPSRRGASSIGARLMKVPFLLPRSRRPSPADDA